MASEEQKQLAAFIKSVHTDLRRDAKKRGADAAWESHCQQTELREKYSKRMKKLAEFWSKNSSIDNGPFSRIDWVVEQCADYYESGRLYQRNREYNILDKLKETPEIFNLEERITKPLKLLDVGSCYNPFNKYDLFNVVAVDLTPASDHVKTCDFLKVECVDEIILIDDNAKEISKLSNASFDVIVFSLLLEYLPSSDQRILCCKKAYKLLKSEGILIIITPDSKHVGANSNLMKSWRYTLANLGFMRIKYEKLTHLHCMIFRKCLYSSVAKRWIDMHQSDGYKIDELIIPQDNNLSSDMSAKSSEKSTIKFDSEICSELSNS